MKPLKENDRLYSAGFVKVSYPLKQGLKHLKYNFIIYIYFVKVSYPLKQGLKHMIVNPQFINIIYVKVSYPLKQGLKQ